MRWFDHVQTGDGGCIWQSMLSMELSGSRRRRCPQIRFMVAVKEDKQRFGVPEEDATVDGSRGSIVATTKGSSSKKMTQLSSGPKESLAFIDVHHDSQQVFYCLLRILMVSFPVGEF